MLMALYGRCVALALSLSALQVHGERPPERLEAIGVLSPGHLVRAGSSPHARHATDGEAVAETRHFNVTEHAARQKRFQADLDAVHRTLLVKNGTLDLDLIRNSFMQLGPAAWMDKAHGKATDIPPCEWIPPFVIWAFVLGCIALVAVVAGVMQEYKDKGEIDDSVEVLEDHCDVLPSNIGADIFGLMLSSLVRNMHALHTGTRRATLRIVHIALCCALLLLNLTFQVYLLYFMHKNVAVQAEKSIRTEYNKYEIAMYGGDTTKMDKIENGHYRGHPKLFNPALFDKLDQSTKEIVCYLPLSQPFFFATLLFIWAITCIGEFRVCIEKLWRFIIITPTVHSMAEALRFGDGDGGEVCKKEESGEGEAVSTEKTLTYAANERPEEKTPEVVEVTIVGLTIFGKLVVVCLELIPRISVAGITLWLGSLWLCATPSFADMIEDVVALAFVLQLKDIVYLTVVPQQTRDEAERTLVLPLYPQGSADVMPMFGSFAWLGISLMYVYVFIFHVQPVLPDYRWDVRSVCLNYLVALGDGKIPTLEDPDILG